MACAIALMTSLLTFSLTGCHAKPDLTGKYEGSLDLSEATPPIPTGGVTLKLQCTFTKGADGSYTGSLVSPDQSPVSITMNAVTLTGDAVHLQIDSIKASFEGKLSSDGAEITGTFKQVDRTFPLTLKKG